MKTIEKFLSTHRGMTLEISTPKADMWIVSIVEIGEGPTGTETYTFATATGDTLSKAIVKMAVYLS